MNNIDHELKMCLLELLEVRQKEHARRCAEYQRDAQLKDDIIDKLGVELNKAKAEHNELLLAAESQFKEYIEDTTANLSSEQSRYFRPLFNIKDSLKDLRAAETKGKLQDRMRQVLRYIHEDDFADYFHFEKDVLFNMLTKIRPGCIIQPIDSK